MMMKACRVHQFGPPDAIIVEDIAQPAPGPGDVLVQVKAAGVGPWDAWIRAGKSVLPQPLPLTLGSDLAGIVSAIGPDVSGFEPGQAVYGVTNPRFTDAYAEYAIARATMVARKPRGLSDIDAASVPVVAVTAWQALFDTAGVERGQTVLVHGAAGSVGAFVVQMAHRAGARVGGDTQQRSLALLAPGGVLVSIVSRPDEEEAARRGVRSSFMLVEVTTARLTRITELLEARELQTNVGLVLPLAEARTAHEMLDGLRPRPHGKIVLSVGA